MPIELKLATDDTPQPWQAALEFPPAELEYAREGLPSAPKRSWLHALLAIARYAGRGVCRFVSGALLALAYIFFGAAAVARVLFLGLAKFVLLLRRASPVRLYERMRWGRITDAELA